MNGSGPPSDSGGLIGRVKILTQKAHSSPICSTDSEFLVCFKRAVHASLGGIVLEQGSYVVRKACVTEGKGTELKPKVSQTNLGGMFLRAQSPPVCRGKSGAGRKTGRTRDGGCF